MKKKDAEFIFQKLEEWTKCEIMARLGPFGTLEFADYYMKKLEIENEIREFLYGSSNIIVLKHKFKLLIGKRSVTKKKKKKKKKVRNRLR